MFNNLHLMLESHISKALLDKPIVSYVQSLYPFSRSLALSIAVNCEVTYCS